MSTPLIADHDCALFDLDGVVYLGPAPVEGAAQGIGELRRRGLKIGFVTNNAARTPEQVAAHLSELGVAATAADVITSAQACAHLMAEQLPAGAAVLVVGAQALVDEVSAVGLTPVASFRDQPMAVVQGYDPQMTWPRLDDAGFAIQRGALWFASNTDSTRPTDLGLVPGAGSQIDVVRNTVNAEPVVAGKPFAPLMIETIRRLGAARPIFVGDRIDTDIMGAHAVSIDSLFVFTGAHGKYDLAAAPAHGRPTQIGWDLRALLAPPRTPVFLPVIDGQVIIAEVPDDREAQLDLLWGILQTVWASGVDASFALQRLTLIP